ncbi:MAG: FAD-binding oxidoreductase [Myxococcota bacterium]
MTARTPADSRIHPAHEAPAPDEQESLDVWGFRDTAFRVRPDGVVVLSGDRYALCGEELADLLPWVQRTIHPDVSPFDLHPPSYPPEIPAPREDADFVDAIRKHLRDDQLARDPELRLRRGHGHTQEEMYAIKYGRLERVPDLVVQPESEAEVVALVEAAVRHDVCLIPYGGGTNVSDALRCPADEARMIVSVDLGRMDRVLWIDPENRMACIEAGAVGRRIARTLARHGFTLGHEPDSYEFSTLGGWIATYASGMKKNRYGNIEDVVLDATVVTARGVLERDVVFPRESIGLGDARRFVFGSEGALGIVTRAVVRIFPLPEAQVYDSIVFPDFERGVAFMHDLARAGRPPASVRLVDNLQFQLSQMLKGRRRGMARVASTLQKLFVTRIKGFDPERMTACTLVFEGGRDEVAAQRRQVHVIARRHGGLAAGAENGERGYALTFGIAYIRDWIMNHWLIAESFETSVPWSGVLALCENVKRRVREEHAARGLPGRPFISCRVTQVYHTGACVYFYFASYMKGVDDPSHVYAEIERAARDEVLRSGGSLSHHHGIGKLRRGFLPRVLSPGLVEVARQLKQAVDPTNVFGVGNQLFGRAGPDDSTGANPGRLSDRRACRADGS